MGCQILNVPRPWQGMDVLTGWGPPLLGCGEASSHGAINGPPGKLQPLGRFAWGTGRGALALLRNSTVANTSSVSPMFSRSCTLNSPLR